MTLIHGAHTKNAPLLVHIVIVRIITNQAFGTRVIIFNYVSYGAAALFFRGFRFGVSCVLRLRVGAG